MLAVLLTECIAPFRVESISDFSGDPDRLIPGGIEEILKLLVAYTNKIPWHCGVGSGSARHIKLQDKEGPGGLI